MPRRSSPDDSVFLAVPPRFDFERTVRSHGWYDLPPFEYRPDDRALLFAFHATSGVAEVDVRADAAGLRAVVRGATAAEAAPVVRDVLRLDEDLAPARRAFARAPQLVAALDAGGGRLLRAPTVFEDVVKMLCTTNCSWSLTRVMVTRLVERLGQPGPSGRRAFPTPAALAAKPERFFRDGVRAGYRAPYLRALARRVASGALDLAALRAGAVVGAAALTADDVYARLLGIKGVGPYAADNLVRLLGRYDRLGLDSWCRATFKRTHPRARALADAPLDAAIEKRYARFAPYQGLALWLDLTRDWFGDAAAWP